MKLILLLLTLHYALSFFFKQSALACGLFGYVGSKEPNMDKLKILGIYNIERGKHSCGISVNDVITKGYSGEDENKRRINTALFTDFIQTHNLDYTKNKNKTVIGHTRAATVGEKNANNAHPFEFKLENSKFIGAHNGSLTNWTTLRENYNLNPDDYNMDSKVLLGAIAHNQKKAPIILTKYQGAAALIMYDTSEPNTLYAYHGKSKKYENGIAVEERPLFYWQKSENEMYISSIPESLAAIGGDEDTIDEFEHNKIFKIVNGKIVNQWPVNRENVVNTYSTTEKKATPTTPASTESKASSTSMVNGETRSGKSSLVVKEYTTREAILNKRNSLFNSVKEEKLFPDELKKIKGKVYFENFRYKRNGHCLNGKNMVITDDGDILGEFLHYERASEIADRHNENLGEQEFFADIYYFYNGIKFTNIDDYKTAVSKHSAEMDAKEMTTEFTKYCDHPTANLKSTVCRIYENGVPFTGSYISSFATDAKYNIHNGFIDSIDYFEIIGEENNNQTYSECECGLTENHLGNCDNACLDFKRLQEKEIIDEYCQDLDLFAQNVCELGEEFIENYEILENPELDKINTKIKSDIESFEMCMTMLKTQAEKIIENTKTNV